ncbi:MAG: ComEC/Rec2 family competence protein [Chthoniobacterales bacterium]
MKVIGASRHPFVGLALAAGIGIVLGDFIHLRPGAVNIAIAALVIFALAILYRPSAGFTYLLVLCSFLLLHQLRTTATAGLSLAAQLGERPRIVSVTGTVVSEPKVAENGTARFLLQLNRIELEGGTNRTSATTLVRWKGHPSFGDEMQFSGVAAPIAPPRNPGEFDMQSYLARRDVRRALFVRYAEDGVLIRSGGGNPVLRFAQTSRQWLQRNLCRGLADSPDVQDFLSGITLGLRHQTPEDIEEPFQQTGTLHLFAVAGLHVGIVAELLWIVARAVGMARRSAALMIVPLVLFYAAVTGLHVSSIRAAVMTAVFMGGFVVERNVFSLNSLSAAALLLLAWNTNEFFATGFQLSFAVVTAIVLLTDPLTQLFRRLSAPDPFLPRTLLSRSRRLMDAVLVKVTQSASISIAAWIGSLVLLFWYFHLITPVSLIANLVVVPIAFLILAVALLSIVSAPLLPWLSTTFNNANWFLAKAVIAVVHLFAQLPNGHQYVSRPPGLGNALARITVLDLGAGAAVHLRTRHEHWLLDCGSDRDYQRVVREYLHSAGVNQLGALLLSHGDAQHIGGAERLLPELSPLLLIDNPAPDRSRTHKRIRQLIDGSGLRVVRPAQRDVIRADEGIISTIVYPPCAFSRPIGDDQALVVQLRIDHGPRILLMSDSGVATENALLHSGIDLRSEIIIKGQHHSGRSGSLPFLDAVQPKLIVATSSDFPKHERVDDQWVEELRSHDIKIFRQNETGAVELSVWPDAWQARAYMTGEVFRSTNR